MCVGVVAVPGAAGGFLLGSIIIKKMALTTGQQLRAMFFMSIVCLCAMVMFVIQCDTPPLADIPPHRDSQLNDM